MSIIKSNLRFWINNTYSIYISQGKSSLFTYLSNFSVDRYKVLPLNVISIFSGFDNMISDTQQLGMKIRKPISCQALFSRIIAYLVNPLDHLAGLSISGRQGGCSAFYTCQARSFSCTTFVPIVQFLDSLLLDRAFLFAVDLHGLGRLLTPKGD